MFLQPTFSNNSSILDGNLNFLIMALVSASTGGQTPKPNLQPICLAYNVATEPTDAPMAPMIPSKKSFKISLALLLPEADLAVGVKFLLAVLITVIALVCSAVIALILSA